MQRIVAIDADAAVRRCCAAWTTRWPPSGGPVLRDRDGRHRRAAPRRFSRRLPGSQADGLGVDVGVGDAVADRLERSDAARRTARASWCTSAVRRSASSQTPTASDASAAVARSAIHSTMAPPRVPSPMRSPAATRTPCISSRASGSPLVVSSSSILRAAGARVDEEARRSPGPCRPAPGPASRAARRARRS